VAQARAKQYDLRKRVIRGQGAERTRGPEQNRKYHKANFKYKKRNSRVRVNISLQKQRRFCGRNASNVNEILRSAYNQITASLKILRK
jgi:hypothetical protein